MKYRKKPVVIEAVQLIEANEHMLFDWAADKLYRAVDVGGRNCFIVKTLEGEMRGDYGDWLIRGVKGEFYFCKPDIFEMTYEAVYE